MSTENPTKISDINIQHIRTEGGYLYYSDDIIIIGDMKVFARNLENDIYKGNIKIDFNVIVFCMKGSLQMRLNGDTVKINENAIMVLPTRSLVRNVMISPDAECIVLYVTTKVMNQLLGPDIDEWHHIVFRDQVKTMTVTEHTLMMVRSYYNLAKIKVSNVRNRYRHKMICALVQIALYEMLYMFQQYHPSLLAAAEAAGESYSGNHLFNRFLTVLAQTSPKYHPVSYYAEKLQITPKYLSVLCKQCSGKTALEWIEEAVLEEIRFYLVQPDITIKEVARITGFENPSFFGQYVKQHFGCTPATYREKNK